MFPFLIQGKLSRGGTSVSGASTSLPHDDAKVCWDGSRHMIRSWYLSQMASCRDEVAWVSHFVNGCFDSQDIPFMRCVKRATSKPDIIAIDKDLVLFATSKYREWLCKLEEKRTVDGEVITVRLFDAAAAEEAAKNFGTLVGQYCYNRLTGDRTLTKQLKRALEEGDAGHATELQGRIAAKGSPTTAASPTASPRTPRTRKPGLVASARRLVACRGPSTSLQAGPPAAGVLPPAATTVVAAVPAVAAVPEDEELPILSGPTAIEVTLTQAEYLR